MKRSTWAEGGDEHPLARLIVRVLINAVAVWVASRLSIGIRLQDQVSTVLLVAALFGVVNALIKPVFQLLTCPLQMLTLGLFTLVINAAMLGLTSWIAARLAISFSVDGFAAAFVGAVVISVVSWALTSLV
jgi:putative membrane protein